MFKIGQVHLISEADWIMLVHCGNNKIIAMCMDGNRYRNPRTVLNRHNISFDEFMNINGRLPMGETELKLHICDDNINYPRSIDRYYTGNSVSCGTVLTDDEGNMFIVVQVDSSFCGIVNTDGELLTAAIYVSSVVDIARHELFEMGAHSDMRVVGQSYNVINVRCAREYTSTERSEERVL